MKALTIWQPWASLIMIGAKPCEFAGAAISPTSTTRRLASAPASTWAHGIRKHIEIIRGNPPASQEKANEHADKTVSGEPDAVTE
jgi:hypothetical protein